MANRIKLKGTTEESFSIALSDVSLTPNKTMDGIVLSTDYLPTYLGTLKINGGAGIGNSVWIGDDTTGGFLVLGGNSGTNGVSTIQWDPSSFSLIGPLGSGTTAWAGGNIIWSAGAAASGHNAPGGNANINGGNGEGTGNGGNVNIQAGGPNGSGAVGNVVIEGKNLAFTILNELQVNADAGASGEVLTSQGPGSPPIWAPASVSPGSTGTAYELIVATASQTVFNTAIPTVAAAGGISYLEVYVNGLFQEEDAGQAYTVTGGNQITFNAGLNVNDRVAIYATKSSAAYEVIVATAAQTVVNTTIDTTAISGNVSYLQVYVNGLFQEEDATQAYTVTGANQITFNAGLNLNDRIVLYGY